MQVFLWELSCAPAVTADPWHEKKSKTKAQNVQKIENYI